MRVLVLYRDTQPDECPLTIQKHLRALNTPKHKHRIIYWNVFHGIPKWVASLRNMDAVILHTTLLCMRWSGDENFKRIKEDVRWIRDLDCAKIAIPQDEYDRSELLDEWLCDLGVSAVMTNFEARHRTVLYPIMSSQATFYTAFTGYVDENAARYYSENCLPSQDRPLDIVYRGKRLPYWFGSHGQVKHRIAQVVMARAQQQRLRCDISTRPEDTINGRQWLEFLASGKTVIGCEGGCSVLDRRGEIRAHIEDLFRQYPELSFQEAHNRMPAGWDDYEFFAISPRHFEAAITKTCQILVEGHYNGVLEPNKHYIPLRQDFSNVDEVLAQIQDVDLVHGIVERAYEDIVLSGKYSYQRFAELIESAIEEALGERARAGQPGSEHMRNLSWGIGSARALLSDGERWILRRAGPRLNRFLMHSRVYGNPMYYLRLCLAARIILSNRSLARILRNYLLHDELRREIGLARLLNDLLRLGLLQAITRGRFSPDAGAEIDVSFDTQDNTLLVRSKPASNAAQSKVDGTGLAHIGEAMEQGAAIFKRIVWNHSAIGHSIIYPLSRYLRLTISLEPKGVYEFTALSAFARQFPKEAWQALIPLHTEPPANYGHPG